MKFEDIKIGDKVRNRISCNKAKVIELPNNHEYIEVRVDRGNANHVKARWKVCNVETLNVKK